MTIEMSRNSTYFPQYAKQASVLRGIIVDWLNDNLFIFSNLPDFGKPILNPSINLSSLFFTLESEDGVVSVKPSARKIMIEISIKRQPLFSTLGYECNPGDK